jgi:hypothetical protein
MNVRPGCTKASDNHQALVNKGIGTYASGKVGMFWAVLRSFRIDALKKSFIY